MSTTTGRIRTSDYVPEDYSDLFEHYWRYVVKLVRSFGIDDQNAEDVAMTILTKFLEKDALADYRPEFVSNHGGVARPAVFTTFLSGFVFAYVRHHRDRQTITKRREPAMLDAPVAQDGTATTWIEMYGPVEPEDHDDIYHDDLVRAIRRSLEAMPPSARAHVNIVALFDRMVAQISTTGQYDTAALAAEFGVSQSAIRNWILRLRDEISNVLSAS